MFSQNSEITEILIIKKPFDLKNKLAPTIEKIFFFQGGK